jgi:predicted dienelactone hydrolase
MSSVFVLRRGTLKMRLSRILVISLTAILLLAIAVGSVPAQEAETLPLAERGPYGVGMTTMTFVDESREDRELLTGIWYPAIIPEGEEDSQQGLRDAEPDAQDAPYPLILFSPPSDRGYNSYAELFTHLVSHGFVVASIAHWHDYEPTRLIDRPMDVLFVLDQMSVITESSLAGIIDADHAGVMGHGSGGYTTFAAAGAQIDPDSLAADRYCSDQVAHWDEIVGYLSRFGEFDEEDLWPSATDERIRAIMPVGHAGYRLFGARGLASVTIPTLMLASTLDPYNSPYEETWVPTFTHLGAEERYMITFVNYGHYLENTPSGKAYYKHFSVAFFGYYLHGQEDYAGYLTADFVDKFEDLAWGPVETQRE